MSSLIERLKNFNLVRKIVYAVVGLFSYPGLAMINKLKISGTEHLKNLPQAKRFICQQSSNLFCRRNYLSSYFLCCKMG